MEDKANESANPSLLEFTGHATPGSREFFPHELKKRRIIRIKRVAVRLGLRQGSRDMKRFTRTALFILATTPAGILCAGPKTPAGVPEPRSSFSICDWLASKPGNLYSNPENPWIQDITFNTRFHWQYAMVDGFSDNRTTGERNQFSYRNRGEVRRLYFGPTIKFLDAFTLKAEANMAKDDKFRGLDRDWGYDSMFEFWISADLKKLIDPPFLDALTLSYGKYEQKYTEEHMTSSRDIYTAERSMLDTWILPGVPIPSNPTGIWFDAKKGPHTVSAGAFSTDHSTELSNWDDGRGYWITYRQDLTRLTGLDLTEVSANYIWNDTNPGDQDALNYDWVSTVWGRIGDGRWSMRGSLIYGANRSSAAERGGYFGGIDLLPTYWLVQDRLMFTMRGEYARSTQSEGLRLSSRYGRAAGAAANENLPDLAGGFGDTHYSLYAGLNYHYCSNLANKIILGVEWERMENSKTNLTPYEGVTWWLAYRTSF